MSHAQAHAEPTRALVTAPPLPREHGAWIGLGAACLVGLLAGGTPGPLSAVACAAAFAFFAAKTSAEHFAIGLRPERASFWLTAFVTLGGLLLALLGDRLPAAAGGAPVLLAAAMAGLFAHGAARAGKVHRTLTWEAAGFLAIGCAAGLVALAQGTAPGRALAVSLLLGGYLASTVPFVRLRVRPARIRTRLVTASILGYGGAIAASLLLVGAGLAPVGVLAAFLPGAVRIALALLRREEPLPAKRVGLEETAWTALFSLLLVALL